jgi:hypothetical protein
MTQWIYLSDLAPKARILNPASGEIREIMQSAVKDKAPIGLRRYMLEELPGGSYRETGALADLTPRLVEDMTDHSVKPNSWNFDYPDYAFETQSDPEELARVRARLEQEMADYPYEFQITGLQRRYLLYFSDGNLETQQAFEALLPTPDQSPLRSDGTLRRPFAFTYNHLMRDAKAPWPRNEERLYGGLRPCLYRGPAYVVRFLLDGQDVLLERCRVYVDPQGNFLCSDWCQRHDFSSYNNGINLQMGIYTFSTWVTGPCLVKNGGNFVPKNTRFERTAVRDMLKRHVLVPTFDETLAKATKKIAMVSKALPPKPVAPVVGPITADAMAEAMAAAAAIFANPKTITPSELTPAVSPRIPIAADTLHAVACIDRDDDEDEGELSNFGYLVQYEVTGTSHGQPVIKATKRYHGTDFHVPDRPLFPVDESETEYFVPDESSPTLFWYGDVLPVTDDDHDTIDQLNKHWWLYSAAVYYRNHLTAVSPLEATLLEA